MVLTRLVHATERLTSPCDIPLLAHRRRKQVPVTHPVSAAPWPASRHSLHRDRRGDRTTRDCDCSRIRRTTRRVRHVVEKRESRQATTVVDRVTGSELVGAVHPQIHDLSVTGLAERFGDNNGAVEDRANGPLVDCGLVANWSWASDSQ